MNKYIKIYESGNAPSFSITELEHLQNDETLNRNERGQFRDIYLRAKEAIEKGKAIPSKIIAFVQPECGKLVLTIGEYLKIEGDNDIEISYDELVSMAFDINTPEDLSLHYQDILNSQQKCVKEWNTTWDRFIFLKNIYTGKIKVWFD